MGNFLTSVVGQEAQNRLAVPPESPAVAGFQGRNDGDPHTPSRLHEPRLVDILVAQSMLVKGCKLPLEVALLILDFAEYWAHSSNELNFSGLGRYKTVRGSTSGENMFLLRSYPVGLLGHEKGRSSAQQLAYDTKTASPKPLAKEHDARYFSDFAPYPTPVSAGPVRKLVFHIRSHDQGWAGGQSNRGTYGYNQSYTWFEVGLERFDADQECDPHCTMEEHGRPPSSPVPPRFPVCALRPLLPVIAPREGPPRESAQTDYTYVHPLGAEADRLLQANKTAVGSWQHHQITWSCHDSIDPKSEAAQELRDRGRGPATGTGTFVRSLKLGDVVTVWGMARFPGWVNFVDSIRIDVHWAL